MATAFPLDHAELAGAPSAEGLRVQHFLPYAQQVEREHPGHLASLGMTAHEYAAGVAEPGLTIDASVAAGLMLAAEPRFIQGHATREDLHELGYSPDEIEAILEEQEARATSALQRRARPPAIARAHAPRQPETSVLQHPPRPRAARVHRRQGSTGRAPAARRRAIPCPRSQIGEIPERALISGTYRTSRNAHKMEDVNSRGR